MWKLEKHTSKQEDEYFELIFNTINNEIDRIKIDSKKAPCTKRGKPWEPPVAIDSALETWFRNRDNVKKIILAQPRLMLCIERLYQYIIKKYPSVKWEDIQRIINYDAFTKKSHSSKLALKLAEIKNVRTCPYCNRAFTMLVIKNNSYVLRADFDHFLAQSKYPLFALSLYNLIPSCLNCNRTIKRDKELDINKHLHPYLDNNDRDKWEFKYRMTSVGKYLLEIDTSKCTDNKVDETMKFLKLEEIYQKAHSDYELKDLIDLNKSYGKRYINDIITNIMKDSRLSERDVYSHLFGIEIDSHNDLNRVLNKMRRDIINKLKQ